MSTLANKVDFEVIISATDANPNGDPLSGNRPRINSKGPFSFRSIFKRYKYRVGYEHTICSLLLINLNTHINKMETKISIANTI